MIDNDLFIEKLKAGDAGSFACLYDTYGEKIYKLAYRMSGNKEDAADITQETFLKVFRYISTFREESGIYTWIYAIAMNQCRQLYNRRMRSSFISFEDLIREAGEMKTDSAIPELEKQILIGQVKEGCLTGLLGCLTFYQRTAFILHVLLNVSVRDTAVVLQKTEGAIKVLIYRARTQLKEFLCKNCSVYDAGNPCRCENLLGFSLKQGWISLEMERGRKTSQVAVMQATSTAIEDDIIRLRKEIEVYRGLDELSCPEGLNRHMRDLIESEDWSIFLAEKA